jgi:hypothetical protein
MQPFIAYLQTIGPETLALLKNGNVSFQYREKYEYRVRVRSIFDQLSNSPYIDKIKEAAKSNSPAPNLLLAPLSALLVLRPG